MTTPPLTNPLLSPEHLAAMAQAAQQTAPPVIRPPSIGTQAPPPISTAPAMETQPNIPYPAMPNVTKLPSQTDIDKTELARKINTGSGIDQIAGKIEGTKLGQAHPLVGKLLGGAAQGLATLGDVGLRSVAPMVDLAIPGTSLHHLSDLHQGERQVAADESNDEKEAQTAGTQATTENTKATTSKTLADLANLPEVNADRHALTQSVIDKNNQDKAKTLNQMHADAVAKAIAEGRDPHTDPDVNNLADAITSLQPGENKEAAAPKTIQIEVNGKPHQMAWNPASKKYDMDMGVSGEKPTQAPGITMIVPNAEGGGTVQRLTAGQTVAPGAQTAAGVNSLNTPTTTQRTAAGRAETVVAMAPGVIQEINSMGKELGPVMGRWNDFMQGKTGMDNPAFAGLRSDLLMMSSAVALAHAQGRLPENLREEFDHAINAPNQTPANLVSTINHMLPWLQQMQKQGQPNARQSNEPTPRPAGVPEGYVHKDGPKGVGWYAPTAK